jgi:hypothetical protein
MGDPNDPINRENAALDRMVKGICRGCQILRNSQEARWCGPAGPPPRVQANNVFLPWGRHRAGRIADEHGPMGYFRIAEMAIALISGLTFALVGWWEIVGEILSALE